MLPCMHVRDDDKTLAFPAGFDTNVLDSTNRLPELTRMFAKTELYVRPSVPQTFDHTHTHTHTVLGPTNA
jgi:hypothetical protein